MQTIDLKVWGARRRPRAVAVSAACIAIGSAATAAPQPFVIGLGLAVAWLGLGALLYFWTRGPVEHPVGARSPAGGRPAGHYWTLARPFGEPRAFLRPAILLAVALMIGGALGQSAPYGQALLVVALAALALAIATPTRAVVGGDGLLLRWLGTSRFVPWASVVWIESFDGAIVLTLDRGRWLTLRMPRDHERHHPEHAELVARMRAALRGGCARGDDPAARLLVRRGGHTGQWVRAMRALSVRPWGYRTAPLPAARLWSLVGNARVDRRARTGAAIALASSLDDRGRERLRAIAGACADPRLRIALTAASDPASVAAADDDLAATLDAIECDGPLDDDDADGTRVSQ
jgi:hypothetical protein